eukprot:GHVT01020887.1.p1 GENE.GHVT01020887.1~~GHVT01020887.1.p1  ORF type:complete len:289 (-),score=30.22 GHVT01020887.1:201-1067(-)
MVRPLTFVYLLSLYCWFCHECNVGCGASASGVPTQQLLDVSCGIHTLSAIGLSVPVGDSIQLAGSPVSWMHWGSVAVTPATARLPGTAGGDIPPRAELVHPISKEDKADQRSTIAANVQKLIENDCKRGIPLFLSFKISSHQSGLKSSGASSDIFTSFPVCRLETTQDVRGVLQLELGESGLPFALSYSVQQAPQGRLMSSDILFGSSPSRQFASPPLVPPPKAHDDVERQRRATPEIAQPSFLQRYWWVIILGILFVSLTGPQQAENAEAGQTSQQGRQPVARQQGR